MEEGGRDEKRMGRRWMCKRRMGIKKNHTEKEESYFKKPTNFARVCS